jgi:hypothetical protein
MKTYASTGTTDILASAADKLAANDSAGVINSVIPDADCFAALELLTGMSIGVALGNNMDPAQSIAEQRSNSGSRFEHVRQS